MRQNPLYKSVLFLGGMFLFLPVFSQVLLLQENHSNSSVVFTLMQENISLDTLQIQHVDFSFCSLNQLNDSMFHFIYEDKWNWNKYDSNMTKKRQVLLLIENSKINVAFTNIKEYSRYTEDSLVANRGDYFFIENCNLIFDSLDNGKLYLHQNKVTIEELESIVYDTLERTIEYNYDVGNKVFYSKKDTLNGNYKYEIVKNNNVVGFKDVFFCNEIVFVNDYDNEFFSFFLRGSWFEITGLNLIFTAFREIQLDSNLLKGITKTASGPYELISVDSTHYEKKPAVDRGK